MFNSDLLKNSRFYQECLAEKHEILRHKWFKSEKAGTDVGFERAYLDWILYHRDQWRSEHRQKLQKAC
jgi:hypothetical protein